MTKQFRNIHIYLSLFFLPLALMYALSGILYIAGINQDLVQQSKLILWCKT